MLAWLGPIVVVALAALFLFLLAQRFLYDRGLAIDWDRLSQGGADAAPPRRFDPAAVRDLPAPAQRLLRHTFAPGAALASRIELSMEGLIALDPHKPPLPFHARQILSRDRGLLWRAEVGSGAGRFVGDDRLVDGRGSMHWFLFGIVPVLSADGPEVSRSGAGRMAQELPLFLPAALLDPRIARWEAVDGRSARLHVTVAGETLTIDMAVDDAGRVVAMESLRFHPAGGGADAGYVRWVLQEASEEQTFDGVTLPTRLKLRRAVGTPFECLFFDAKLTTVRFY